MRTWKRANVIDVDLARGTCHARPMSVAHSVSEASPLVDYFDNHRDPVEAMLDRDLPWDEFGPS